MTGEDKAPAAVWDPAELLAGRSAVNLQKKVEILALRFPLSLFKSASANLVLLLTEFLLCSCRSLLKLAKRISLCLPNCSPRLSKYFSSRPKASSVPLLCARLFPLSSQRSYLYVLDSSKCSLVLFTHLSSSTRVCSVLLTSV